jgi:hypothetical protein
LAHNHWSDLNLEGKFAVRNIQSIKFVHFNVECRLWRRHRLRPISSRQTPESGRIRWALPDPATGRHLAGSPSRLTRSLYAGGCNQRHFLNIAPSNLCVMCHKTQNSCFV